MNVVEHYDKLIDENNDPFRDPQPLQEYMNLWDGEVFLDSMCLTGKEAVLEVGVGTGRIAVKVIPRCAYFTGIDISPKTVGRAKDNLSAYSNVDLICADFLNYNFTELYDVVYSSLTLMHFEDKQAFISKVFSLLKDSGRLVLSIDKNQDTYIDMGNEKLLVYPDTPEHIIACVEKAGMKINNQCETEFAHIFICLK